MSGFNLLMRKYREWMGSIKDAGYVYNGGKITQIFMY